MHFVVQMEGK